MTMATHPFASPLLPRWTDRPPFNNAVNTVLVSIGLAGLVYGLYVVFWSMFKSRHELMYQDNGIAGLICCYPFRALDRRRKRKEAARLGYSVRVEEPPLLSSEEAPRIGEEAVGGRDEERLDKSRKAYTMGLLREDGTRVESIDITRI